MNSDLTRAISRLSVSVASLFRYARDLKSEHGENPEYDRALCELLCDAAGVSMDHVPDVAAEIGIISGD